MQIGNFGASWSSTASSSGGMRLDFHAKILDPCLAGRIGHGLQLRCLSE
ncbi:hypothetical protein [uncultured Rikenella sp.]|nr:hypothetical protein [uncultured Rikenella sp.]